MEMQISIIKGMVWLILWSWVAMAHAGTKSYFYTDPQGTVLAKADAQGNIVSIYDYAPYGAQALGSQPEGPTGYTGHVNDAESGLVYMQARYYAPETGRFLSVDPNATTAANTFNFNRYEYANNNPTINIDPDGRQSTMAAGVWTGQSVMAQQSPRQLQRLNEINARQARVTGSAIGATAGGEAALLVKAVLMLRNVLEHVPQAAPKGDFHAPGDVPNSQIIVRGGTSDMPAPGQVFSGSQGNSVADAAAGVPHGQIRVSTAENIRANGGRVDVAPEPTRTGQTNGQHVNVTEGGSSSTFSNPPQPNPVPKVDRVQ